jgi:putative spermidine/putrescine transport system substrate-binding protein
MKDIRRRTGTVMGAAVSLVAVVVSACGSSSAGTSKASASALGYPTPGSSPISLNILDIAGNLQLSAGAITEFANAHTNWLSGQPSETTAAAPTLVSKLQPEEQSGNVTTDLVLTGTDGLASGIVNGL